MLNLESHLCCDQCLENAAELLEGWRKNAEQRYTTTVNVLLHTNRLYTPMRLSPKDDRPRTCKLLDILHGPLVEESERSGPRRRQECPLQSSYACRACNQRSLSNKQPVYLASQVHRSRVSVPGHSVLWSAQVYSIIMLGGGKHEDGHQTVITAEWVITYRLEEPQL